MPSRHKGNARVRGSHTRQGGKGDASAIGFASADASESLCPVSAKCGACSLIDVPYEEQLARKQQFVARLFEDVAPEDAVVEPVLGMGDPFYYRAKVISPFAPGRKIAKGASRGARGKGAGAAKRRYGKDGRTRKGEDTRRGIRAAAPCCEILTGMYAAHSHRLVPTDECLLENRQAKAVILTVRDLMYRFGIEPYNEDTGEGFLRHAVVRVGHESGEMLVTLVTNAKEFPASRSFCRELVKRCPFVTTVVQNVNLRQTNVILGDEERTLFGPGFILDKLCGLSFRISSRSFYQVNSAQTEVLYRCAIELAGLTGAETVIDAYCGTGTIGLVAAKMGAARVIGVDSVAAAIRDARQNACHNGVENTEFVAADAADFMRDLAARRIVTRGSVVRNATEYLPNDERWALPSSVARNVSRETFSGESKADRFGKARKEQVVGGEADRSDKWGAAVHADPMVAASRVEASSNTVLFMDPPRAGASEEFLDAVCALSPAHIVYISCNPETQARDAAYLARAGYLVRKLQPVDMFPHTDHIECIALIEREQLWK